MKKLTYLLVGSAFAAASANAEIVLTDDLSAYGYIDLAYATSTDASDFDGSVAEFELGFAFSPVESPWSAVAELSFDDGDNNNSYDFETVAVTYAYLDELSFSVGNILSYQGFETYDATGLYQFSYQGFENKRVYSAGYAFGASADYVTDEFGAGLWIGDSDDGNSLSLELFLQYTGVEGLTATAVFADDTWYETINLWASYEINAFTFAVEYTDTDKSNKPGNTANEQDAFMVMGYYSFGDGGLTVRYTDGEVDGTDYDRFTISPSYAFSDNVLGLLEWSLDDPEDGAEESTFAAEMIFTF